MPFNNVGHLITSTITTLQHLATLHHTSPKCTSLQLSKLYFFSFSLHYLLIWLNTFRFPTALFHLASLNQTQCGYHILKLISKIMNPFPALKNLSPFHFTFFFFLLILSALYFTLLCYSPLQLASPSDVKKIKHRQHPCFALQGCVLLSKTSVTAALPLCHLVWPFMLSSWSSFQICRRSVLKQCAVR